jgi:hypothetical protein
MNGLKSFIAIALCFIPLAGLHATSIYKWTDSEGNVHFGEAPPPQQHADKIQLPKNTINPPAQPSEQEVGDNATPQAESDLSTHFTKNCNIARQNLQTYTESRRFLQADGSVTEISEEVRTQKMKEMEEAVNRYCK